jgi:hypothetical protein
VTIVSDDMQAPVLVLGTRRWQAPAIQSRVRYTGEHSGSASVPGLVCGPFAGAAGRSRDTRSKQEDPIRFRTLIDAGKPELYGRQQPFRPLLGSGGALARWAIYRPRPPRIALRKIRSRLSAPG